MNPSILILTDLTAAAEQVARVAAALGAPLQAKLTLLHLPQEPLVSPEMIAVSAVEATRYRTETAAALRALADRLPTPTGVLVAPGTTPDAMAWVMRRYQPLLLVMGLSAEHDPLDYLLRNQLQPVLRATHWPLLLVPAAAPATLPRRVLLALDAEPFTPNPATRQLLPLLAAWDAAYTVTHAVAPTEQQAFAGQRALGQLRLSELLPAAAQVELYEPHHLDPAAGVLQAVEDTQAELLVLVARPRSFLGNLFHRSVTAEVLRHCQVPVLLLPAEAPELPGWMPAMS